MDLSEEPEFLLNFLRDRRRAVMEGRLRPKLPIKTEIALYDHIIWQLERDPTHRKNVERDLSDKWYQSAVKTMDQLRRLKDLKATNRLLSESFQHKIDELNEVLDAKHRLDEIVISKQNTVNFS